MATTGSFSLFLVFILTGGISFLGSYAIDNAFATKPNCSHEILSLLQCSSKSDYKEALAIAFAKAIDEKENPGIGIDATDSTSGITQARDGNNIDSNNKVNGNIESQIPSTISAIPFP